MDVGGIGHWDIGGLELHNAIRERDSVLALLDKSEILDPAKKAELHKRLDQIQVQIAKTPVN